MRMIDWSSDVCSSDLSNPAKLPVDHGEKLGDLLGIGTICLYGQSPAPGCFHIRCDRMSGGLIGNESEDDIIARSEEHTSELQSLMRSSYAVFCLKKKNLKHKYNLLKEQQI